MSKASKNEDLTAQAAFPVGTKLQETGTNFVYTVTAVIGAVGELVYFLELEKGGNLFSRPQRYVNIPSSRITAKFEKQPVE
jgi:hypothetical protein